MPLQSASRVGPYEILSTLGGGAMGEVYRARDPRLSRNVALKILSSDSLQDPVRRRRFAQEARSASALNHPNIVTIHDFGTMDGIYYIVSELIDGEPLRALIARGPLPVRRLLDIATQIAAGLAAAHQAGIVHRDLKPENIMVTPDGRVKILDFGLAKPLDQASETMDGEVVNIATSDGSPTQPGLILGTVGYMSPEQARGMPVGFQTDQFSLGIVLHEMATGQQPFRRETPMQTLLEIANLTRVPFTPGPVAFRLLVARCLAKDPQQRFSSTHEIHDRLRRILDELPEKGDQKPMAPARIRRARRIVTRAAVVRVLWGVLVFCLGLLAARLIWPSRRNDLSAYKFTAIAASPSIEVLPAISPNSKAAAYAADVNGIFQVFTRTLGSPFTTQVTSASDDCFFPFWSRDGARVYYVSKEKLWSVGASGGSPELVWDNVVRAALSPDGSDLVMLRRQAGSGTACSLWYCHARELPRRYETGAFRGKRFLDAAYLAFAPDGSKLALWASGIDGRSEFWVIPWPAGEPKQSLQQLSHAPLARMFSWMPDSARIVYGEREGISTDDHLWEARVSSGSRHVMTMGTGREQSPSVSADGAAVAFASVRVSYSIRQFPLTGGPASPGVRWNEASPRSVSESSPAWSPARAEYAYATDRDGAPEIWLKDAGSGWERRIVGAQDFSDRTLFLLDISFSPDGHRIAYRRGGNDSEAIWISTVSGDPPARIADEPGHAFQRGPTWSPDGNWIAYYSIRDGKNVLMKARSDGSGPPTLISTDAGVYPVWSPDGGSIAVLRQDGLVIMAADGAHPRHISSGEWLAATWTKHGSELIGLRRSVQRQLELVAVAPDGANEQVKTSLGQFPPGFSYGRLLSADPVRGASISRDGKWFFTSTLDVDSDLWLMTGFGR